MDAIDPKEVVTTKIQDAVVSFVEAVSEVWPLDTRIAEGLAWLRSSTEAPLIVSDRLVGIFTKEDIKMALAKDASFWNHGWWASYDASSKWDSANDEIRECCWEHMKNIGDFLSLQHLQKGVPTKLMDTILDLTKELKSDDGTINSANLNPMAIGQKIMSTLSADEMKDISNQMMAAIGNDPSAILNMVTSMKGLLPAGAMDSMPELSSMVEMLGPALSSKNFDPSTLNLPKFPFGPLKKKPE